MIIKRLRQGLFCLSMMFASFCCSGGNQTQLIDIIALTQTQHLLAKNSHVIVRFQVTNLSDKNRIFRWQPQQGVKQLTHMLGACKNPIALAGHASCQLVLKVSGKAMGSGIKSGPVLCDQDNKQCVSASGDHKLDITSGPENRKAMIHIEPDSDWLKLINNTHMVPLLNLLTNGPTGQFTIRNESTNVTAFNIQSNFADTALSGNITESANTCAQLAPGQQCTLTYLPGGTVVPQTNFTISGTNTSVITAAIVIQSSVTVTNVTPNSGTELGGTGITITGTGFTGTPTVTFNGNSATFVNVVNSTTLTAVTPAGAVGAVNVTVTTAFDNDTLNNGYTYLASAEGQATGGGVTGCLLGGLNNLVAATSDVAPATLVWGSVVIDVPGTNATDGASNTPLITAANGAGVYAASECEDFEIDSQGNTPCQAGNECYNDWFLPASIQMQCFYTNRVAIGGFFIGPGQFYWTSTQQNISDAFVVNFDIGGTSVFTKSSLARARCARALP